MAKDPAFLFYSQDFIVGTNFMNYEQRGKYITLLCYQHQYGKLTEEHMINICKTYDKDIFSKFKKDKDGLYYNERLENEVVKRKEYSESRRKNRTSKKNICKSYVEHMENENENINNNINGTTKKSEFPNMDHEFPVGHCKDVALNDATWVMNSKATEALLNKFNAYLLGQGIEKKHIGDYKKHFYNWLKKNPTEAPKKLVFK